MKVKKPKLSTREKKIIKEESLQRALKMACKMIHTYLIPEKSIEFLYYDYFKKGKEQFLKEKPQYDIQKRAMLIKEDT